MADYRSFTVARSTEPDFAALVANLKALDPSAGVQHTPGTQVYVLKKATAWTTAQANAAQNVLNTTPESSPQLTAQAAIDSLPLVERAIILTLIDETNRLRAALRGLGVANLPDVSVQTAMSAVRNKAGTL